MCPIFDRPHHFLSISSPKTRPDSSPLTFWHQALACLSPHLSLDLNLSPVRLPLGCYILYPNQDGDSNNLAAKDGITSRFPTDSRIESSLWPIPPYSFLLITPCHLLWLHQLSPLTSQACTLSVALSWFAHATPVHLSTRSGPRCHPLNEVLSSYLDQLGMGWLCFHGLLCLSYSCHGLRCSYPPVCISPNGHPLT